MNTINITFTHSEASAPQYTFGARVAVADVCEPEAWATGKVLGLQLEEIFPPRWWYTVKLDKPLGFAEEYLTEDLVPEAQIPTLQAQWELIAQSEAESEIDSAA